VCNYARPQSYELVKGFYFYNVTLKSIAQDPKDGELCLRKLTREEILVEDLHNSNAQIDCIT